MEINENSIAEQKKIRDLQASFDKSMKILESHIAESITNKDKLESIKRDLREANEKFLDAENFADGTNATADNTAEFPQEIYYIDRKSGETRDVVSWELAAVFDLAGIRVPKRQCTRSEFPSIGTFR